MMKKINLKYILGAALLVFATSACEDALDINTNPNAATTADVQLVLPQAITASSFIANQYNTYGAHFGGYMANAGGFSGFGNLLNYNLTPGDWNGLWVSTYQDPLTDLKYVMDKSEGKPELAYFNAAAKIMTVVNFQRLVDAFGDIPYSQALKGGEGIVTPAYDDAATIYRDLYTKLDEAIATINAAGPEALRLTKATDPLFGSNDAAERSSAAQMADWIKYANTLKLRILVRVSGVPSFSSFVTEGAAALEKNFLTADAIVDPGFEANKPSPTYLAWGKTPTGALSNTSRIPTRYAFGFYSGKLNDPARGEAIYVNFPSTPINQLGNEDGAPTIIANNVTWASNQTGYTGRGVLKGPAQGVPLMTAAESYFLQAEANLRGIYGSAAAAGALFDAGITASFTYIFLDENETLGTPTGTTIESLVSAYKAANTSYLVNYSAAASDAQRLEAIITQKYIALNMINSDEAWNEYRRTGYPATVPGGAANLDIASNKSSISGGDRLPKRILYPSSEQSYNAANYRNVDYASEKIFWDVN
jgi:hypothetical protein